MQKIAFVSILLLAGLFSLQLHLTTSSRTYYTGKEKMQVQPVIFLEEEPEPGDYELKQDSTGAYYFERKEKSYSL